MPDLTTTFKFALEIDSINIGFFKKCTGLGSENEIIEYKEVNSSGQLEIFKRPGALKWPDIVLERRLDSSLSLWEWRQLTIDGEHEKHKRNGSIVAMDSEGGEVARWNFERGWVSNWSGADFDASSNDVATESVTITHEGLVRA